MDQGIAYIRDEVMPAVTAMDDCIGLSTLVDRESGECIVTSSWKSVEAMTASDLHLAPLRRRGGEIMGGAPQVDGVGGRRDASRPPGTGGRLLPRGVDAAEQR